jgi:transcriptional regulator with XRE-family HTH domain
VGEHARIVGERIKLLRDEKGWGQAELAERLHAAGIGTNRETISRWESGKAEPTAGTLKVVAAVFGVTMDYLNGAEDESGHRGNAKWDGTLQSLKDDEKILLSLYGELGEDEKRFLRRQIEALRHEQERGDD